MDDHQSQTQTDSPPEQSRPVSHRRHRHRHKRRILPRPRIRFAWKHLWLAILIGFLTGGVVLMMHPWSPDPPPSSSLLTSFRGVV